MAKFVRLVRYPDKAGIYINAERVIAVLPHEGNPDIAQLVLALPGETVWVNGAPAEVTDWLRTSETE